VICVGISLVGFVLNWVTPVKVFPLLLLGCVGYLAGFVIALNTLGSLKSQRAAGVFYSWSMRVQRLFISILILVYYVLPLLLFVAFLVALILNPHPFTF
jgi:hypothetical protein